MSSPSIKARLPTTGHVARNDHGCETFSYQEGLTGASRGRASALPALRDDNKAWRTPMNRLLASTAVALLLGLAPALAAETQGSFRPGPAYRRKPRKRRPCRRRVVPTRPVALPSKVRLGQIQRPATRTPLTRAAACPTTLWTRPRVPRSRVRHLPDQRLRAPLKLIRAQERSRRRSRTSFASTHVRWEEPGPIRGPGFLLPFSRAARAGAARFCPRSHRSARKRRRQDLARRRECGFPSECALHPTTVSPSSVSLTIAWEERPAIRRLPFQPGMASPV